MRVWPGCAALVSGAVRRISYVESCLASREGLVVAATDYMRSYADQIRAFVPRRYVVLGTFLAEEGTVPRGLVSEALEKYGIDSEDLIPR